MITHSLMKVKESAFSFTELAKATPFFHSVRFVLAILGCLMFIHLYAQRVGMSVAIVCMVNQTAVSKPDVNGLNETKVIKADCERDSANGTVEVSLTKLFQI